MSNEYALMILPPVSGFLFAFGGFNWKGWRRYVLPLIFGITCLIYNVVWWQALFITLYSGFVFRLGYGEKKSWVTKVIVGYLYGLTSGILGYTPWQLVIPIAWILMFALSNWRVSAKMFPWKVVEVVTGILIGISIAIKL